MKPLRRALTAALAAACLAQPLTALAAGEADVDMPSPWAEESVAGAQALGILLGEPRGQYQEEITREEFAQVALSFLAAQYNYYEKDWKDDWRANTGPFLNRYLEAPGTAEKLRLTKEECLARYTPETREQYLATFGGEAAGWDWYNLLYRLTPFTDVEQNGVNAPAWAWLLGIVNGRGEGIFAPNDPITRQEAACMLERTYQVYGEEMPGADAEAVLVPFTDGADVADWARESVARMVQSGVMNGVGGNRFAPGEGYTREQCYATFLRLFEDLPTSRAKGNVKPLATVEEERQALVGGICLSAEICYENDFAAVVEAHYGGLPHGASYDSYFALYKAGGRRDLRLSGAPVSWRAAGEETKVLFTGAGGEYSLDLTTGEAVPVAGGR